MSWIEFGKTLIINAIYAPGIQAISDRYPLEITPSTETFQIWGVIYYGIFLTLLLTDHLDDKISTELFDKSLMLNQEWVQAFASDEITKANEKIAKLREINKELVAHLRSKGVNNYYIEMYNAWVNIASVLNNRIEKYNSNDDKQAINELYENVYKTYDDNNISYAEKITLQWAIQGINLISENNDVPFYHFKKLLLGGNKQISFAELFGIENKMIESFPIPFDVVPITKDIPPSIVRFKENLYKLVEDQTQIKYNGFYYQLIE